MDNYLYIAKTSLLDKEDDYNKAYSLLTPYRKERTDKYKYINDKKLSILAERLLKKALKDLNINSSYHYFFNDNKKPFLNDIPLKFNISHSNDYVIVALSQDEVGCDIEYIKDIDLKIADKYFFNSEYINIINSQNKLESFYRYWTLKESFMKATGKGFSLNLNDFEIKIDDQIFVNQSLDNNKYFFKEIEIKDYKCSICLLNNKDVIVKEISNLF